MENEFVGQVVLVTGASRGIGQATAVAFARSGAKVIVNYLSNSVRARETLNQIEAFGGHGWLYPADLSQLDQIEHMVNQVEAEIGPIEVLVNNAAAFNRQTFLEIPLAEMDRVWNTNVRGLFYLSQLTALSMSTRRKGCIVNVSSIGARLAVASRTAYGSSKGAIESLTRCMSLDLAPYNIRVNAVAPGVIRTEGLLDGMPDPDVQAAFQSYLPMARLGEPEEVADAIVFLSSEAARYINGAIIPVDGSLGAREAGFPYKIH